MIALKTVLGPVLLSLLLAGTAAAAEKVNINTADAATIDAVLVNVGASKAEAIVAYRNAHGPFRKPEDLTRVQGIGAKTVEANRDAIVIVEAGSVAEAGARPSVAR